MWVTSPGICFGLAKRSKFMVHRFWAAQVHKGIFTALTLNGETEHLTVQAQINLVTWVTHLASILIYSTSVCSFWPKMENKEDMMRNLPKPKCIRAYLIRKFKNQTYNIVPLLYLQDLSLSIWPWIICLFILYWGRQRVKSTAHYWSTAHLSI